MSGNRNKLYPVDETPRPREQKPLKGKAATQDRILRAAGGLFLEGGYEHTTIADVAELAGVSRATVFWHFGDKAGLFREALSALLLPFRHAMAENLETIDPEQRLVGLIGVYDNFVVNQRETIEGFVRLAIEAPGFSETLLPGMMDLHQRFIGDLCETLSQLIPSDQDPEALAAGLIALMDGNMLLSFFDDSAAANDKRRAGLLALTKLIPRQKNRGLE